MIEANTMDTELNVWMHVIEVMLAGGDTTADRAVTFADTVLSGYRRAFRANSFPLDKIIADKKAA